MSGLFVIVPGRRADYDALARFHYRAGPPAACVRILCAADGATGELIGVLTVSMPTLNGAWRARAWPRLFRDLGKRDRARRVNALLRTISRVIVDPRFRALGVASALVRAYLDDPLTPLTEAVAAMGRFCPFFERAGMRRVSVGWSRRDARLRRVLRELGVRPHELDVSRGARVRGALRVWANDSRATRGKRGVAVLAGAALAARRVVYVAGVAGSACKRAGKGGVCEEWRCAGLGDSGARGGAVASSLPNGRGSARGEGSR